jgi:thymidylate synthase ThyX
MKIYPLTANSEEALAVITARTSRSPKNFKEITNEIEVRGHEEFIKTNVIGYGHDSVAEMAQTPPMAIEDISDLAANVVALADPQLKVQMTSTRYQRMEARNVIHDSGKDGDDIVDMLLHDYIEQIEHLLNAGFTRTEACDVARGSLPAGIKTQVAIRHDARGMRDAVCHLLGHSLPEVRSIGEGIQSSLGEHLTVLFDRHVTPAPSMPVTSSAPVLADGSALFNPEDLRQAEDDGALHVELRQWRESGYRRRHRIARCPHGPSLRAYIRTDYGAYRDLRRNRTIAQSDALPVPHSMPRDPLWAFRHIPELCDKALVPWIPPPGHRDPYLATMSSMLTWLAGGHALNWAYMLRLRSRLPGCHAAYARPMRKLMLQILHSAPRLSDAIGLEERPGALGGVEFRDR